MGKYPCIVSHTIAWPGGIDLCPDSLYAEMTDKDTTSFLTKNVSTKAS